MTLLFYPNFFRGKLPPNKIGLFLIRQHYLHIKIGEDIGEDGIIGRGPKNSRLLRGGPSASPKNRLD